MDIRSRWYRAGAFIVLTVATLGGVALFQSRRPEPVPILLSTPPPLPSPAPTATPRPLRIYVSGAVHAPDVYTLAPDSIVKDALLAARGATDQADLDRINLAAPLIDGQHVYVPHQGEEVLPVPPPASRSAASAKININTATAQELELLPGIGPALAQRIIDFRLANGPFGHVEDIMDVSGIGPATFDKIQEQITTE
jgi:competence protein ComEA